MSVSVLKKVVLTCSPFFFIGCVADFSINKLASENNIDTPVVLPPVNTDLRATISGAPNINSYKSKEEIQVSGTNVVSYYYKIGLSSEIDCNQFNQYIEIPNLNPQTLSLRGIDDGNIKLCVLGKNALGEIQPLDQPTFAIWHKNAPPEVSFSTANTVADEGGTTFSISVNLSHRREENTSLQLGFNGDFEPVTEHDLLFDDWINIPAGQLSAQKSFTITGNISASSERRLTAYISNFNYPQSQPGDIVAQSFIIRSNTGTRNPLADIVGKFNNNCFRKENSSVFCWGSYSGNGTATAVASPFYAGNNFTSISRFDSHACGVKTGGAVYCWGPNNYGQVVGTGDKLTPTHVDPSETYTQVSTGLHHTCGITTQKKIKCWGRYSGGRLGTGVAGSGSSSTPTDITRNDLDWSFVAAGATQTCAIQDGTGHLWCWGLDDNDFYLPVTPISGDQFEPILLDSSDSYKYVDIGSFGGCAITQAGIIKCWGANYAGELAPQVAGSLSELTTVDSGTAYQTVSVGYETGFYAPHTCALTTTQIVKCWGADYGYDFGYLGVFRFQWDDFNLPTVVGSGQTFRAVVSIRTGGYAISEEGDLFYWGNGTNYPNKPAMTSNQPTAVEPLRKFLQISTSSTMTCALDTDQNIYCLGMPWQGLPRLVKVNGASAEFQSIHVTDRKLCAIDNIGYLWCTVENDFLTYETSRTYSKVITFPGGHCALSVGDKKIYCEGFNNSYGELGRGDTDPHSDFAPVLFSGDVIDFTYYNDHGCLIDSLNDVYCWGRSSSFGLLGNGTTADSNVPVKISSAEKFLKISTHYYHTCGVTLGQDVFCWGSDNNNTLGDTLGAVVHSTTPRQADPGSTFKNIFTGESTTCGLTVTNKLRCWGKNQFGNFMVSSPASTGQAPGDVHTHLDFNSVEMVFTGFDTDVQSCAVTTSDDLVCWGGRDQYSIFSPAFHNPSLVPELIFL